MKKLFLVLFCFTAVNVFAGNDRIISADQLPVTAKKFLDNYFKDVSALYIKMDVNPLDRDYDVLLATGTEIEFDRKGNWKKIRCKNSDMPENVIPEQIRAYVNEKCPGQKITKIERDYREYEIKLSQGMELTFSKNFNLIDID